jgi:anti-sigma B factor antagonist
MRITKQHSGSTLRLGLHGELDIATIGEVRDTIIATLTRYAPSAIVLDLRLVTFIDSTAIGQLVACHKAAAVFGATLTLENPASLPHRQLWATGLLGLFGLAPDAHHPTHQPTSPQTS